MNVKELTDAELIEDYKGLHDCVCVAECFSSRDSINLAIVENEMARRGIEIQEKSTIVFKKKGKKIK